MSDQHTPVLEEWRDVRGWVPWLFAGVYFPLYVALDYVAGDVIAAGADLPRSVSVAVFSLAVALVVTVVVTASRLEGVSLSRPADWLDLGARGGTGDRSTVGAGSDRSTVGAGGAVDRKTIRTPPSPTEPLDGPPDAAAASADGGTETGEETDEWPDEWIPADQL